MLERQVMKTLKFRKYLIYKGGGAATLVSKVGIGILRLNRGMA
jgi:hypothetical protein